MNLGKKTCIARYFYILFVKVTGHYCPLIMVGMGTLEKLNFLCVDLFSLEVTYPPIRTQSIIFKIKCKILRFRFWGKNEEIGLKLCIIVEFDLLEAL